MLAVRARVRNGRLTVDEPSDLPEGSELDLVPMEEVDDELSPADLAELDRRIADSRKENLVPAETVFAALRARG